MTQSLIDKLIEDGLKLPDDRLALALKEAVEVLNRMRNENSDPYGIAKYALQRINQIASDDDAKANNEGE